MYSRQAQSTYELYCIQCGFVVYVNAEKTIYEKARERKQRLKELELFEKEEEERAKDKLYYKKRKIVQQYAVKYGINGASRLLNMPRSSVGLLAKGLSIKKFNRGKFDRELKLAVIKRYKEFPNKQQVAKEFDVSRPAIQNWVR